MPKIKRGRQPAQDTGRDDAEGRDAEEIPQEEKDAAGALLQEIERAKTRTKTFRETTLKKWRRYQWGAYSEAEGDSMGPPRTNLIYATMATLLPHVYSKNPEIAVAPTEAVSEDEYEAIKKFCKTATVFENRLLVNEGKLKRRQKSQVRSAMATGMGFVKLSLQESLSGDPLVARRVNDLQDNIERLEYLVSLSKKEHDPTELNKQMAEAKEQVAAIMAGNEVKIAKCFVLDRIQTEDFLVLDEDVREFEDYVDAGKLAMGVWMRKDGYEQRYHHKPYKGTATFGAPAPTADEDDAGNKVDFGNDKSSKIEYVRVWEVWDKTTGHVKTVAEGSPGWCRPPFQPKYLPERWYTFFGLAFNPVEGRFRPLSDTELLLRLQDEYNTTRYLFAETRKEAIPVRVFRKSGGLTEEDIKALVNRRARQFIGVEGSPTIPLNQDIAEFPGAKIDPAAFDVTLIRNDMDMLVGLSDASRANLIEAKTATEAEIMRQALMHRAGERQDASEDSISEIALAALEMGLRAFSPEEIKQVCGPDAVWPELSVEEIFRKVDVSVRAGSTGKPNVAKEREQWAQIMPIINDTLGQVMELRLAGQFDLAESKIELLRETLVRYDEKIDVDRFIPPTEKDAQGKPLPPANVIAQAQQVQEQLLACQEELKKCQEELQACQQQLGQAKQAEQAKVAQIQADQAISVAQENAKAAEGHKKAIEAQGKAEVDAAAASAKEKEETVRERMRLDAEADKHARELAHTRELELLSIGADIVKAGLASEAKDAQGEAKQARVNFDEVVERLSQVLSVMAGDTVADYGEGDSLLGMRREPASVPGDGFEKMMALMQMLGQPQVPQYDEAGRIARVSRQQPGTI